MGEYKELTGTLTKAVETLTGTLSPNPTIQGELTVPRTILPNAYEGAYEITPSSSEQTLETGSLYMTGNVTVKPIPSNYGLITYNGSTITVS